MTSVLFGINLPELININFEIFVACVAWINVRKLLEDKEIKGIAWSPYIIFTCWRFWDVFYMYPALGMRYAALLALISAIGQSVWVCCALYFEYSVKEKL